MCIESEIRYNLTLSLGLVNLIDKFLIEFTENGNFFKKESFPDGSGLLDNLKRFQSWVQGQEDKRSYALYLRESTLNLFHMGAEIQLLVEGSKLNRWSVDISTIKVKTPSMTVENAFHFHNMLLGVILFAHLNQAEDILVEELCELSLKLDNVTSLLSGPNKQQTTK